MDDDIATVHNGYDREDEYYCRMCDVTFREPFPNYYDVCACPRCGWPSWNRCLSFQEDDLVEEIQSTLSVFDAE
jgi:uncharacterized protein (DUF2225 family)